MSTSINRGATVNSYRNRATNQMPVVSFWNSLSRQALAGIPRDVISDNGREPVCFLKLQAFW